MVAIAAAAAVFASAFDLDATNVAVADKWAVWKSQFAMHGADPAHAFAKFAATEARILAHNAQGRSWTLGHNQFSDLAPAEFQALYIGGFNPRGARPKKYANVTALSSAALLSPDSIDWVAKGALPAVKDQAQCGGCWAFATVGAVEGAFQIAGNPLTSLSEQELISCDHSGDQGCNGGNPDNAFHWIKTNNGLPTEQAYPYTSASGNSGTCATGKTPLVTVASYTDVPQDDSRLLAAIAIGPVAVAIEADQSAFQSYSSGILDNPAAARPSITPCSPSATARTAAWTTTRCAIAGAAPGARPATSAWCAATARTSVASCSRPPTPLASRPWVLSCPRRRHRRHRRHRLRRRRRHPTAATS